MFFECRVYDKNNKLKETVSAEEITKRYWEKAGDTCDIVDWSDLDESEKEFAPALRFLLCPTCGGSERTSRESKIYCSPKCQKVAKQQRRKELADKLERMFP